MFPAIIGGGVALGSALLAGRGQSQANKQNIALAREQMAFQEKMSSSAWQRAVKDMKLAGINPMLSFMKGGASSPGGQTAQVKDVLGPAVNSAVSSLRLRNEVKTVEASLRLTRAQTYKTEQEGYRARAEAAAMAMAPQSGAHRGTPYYASGQRALWSRQQLEEELLRAGLPAARVRGTKIAALWQLYGKSAAAAVAGLGAAKFGVGFLRGRR